MELSRSDRCIVISDVHMDAWDRDLKDAAEDKRKAFLCFLKWVADMGHAGKVGRFIIAGDLVDVPSRDDLPLLPRYEDVFACLRAVVDAGVRFGYVVGNHDSGVVGLDIHLTDPPVWIDYPSLVIPSGDKAVYIEHGHLHDPVLLEYVRYHGQTMLAGGGPGYMPLAKEPSPDAAAAEAVHVQMNRVWQDTWQDAEEGSETASAVAAFLAEDLQRDYSEDIDPVADADMIARREELARALSQPSLVPPDAVSLFGRRRAPAAPAYQTLLKAYCVAPLWRAAARQRLAAMEAPDQRSFAGIVMGHTHFADRRDWEMDGTPRWYINSGSWRYSSADMVVIQDGEATLHERRYTEALPVL